MIKPEQIPTEAVEAARKFMRLQALSDEWIDDLIAAALSAWPGMSLHQQDINAQYSYFVLPLAQENSDD